MMHFPPSSRYHGIAVAILERDHHTPITYLRRRFIPLHPSPYVLTEHVVQDEQRLDHIAFTYLGDPEQFWRLCDSNTELRPEALTETVGRRIIIPLVQGR
jgi:hypothetical protein